MRRSPHLPTLILALAIVPHLRCAVWGALGHRAIAETAERHLTAGARTAIERYTHGTPPADYATFMDEVVDDPRYKEPFAGWHASIADPEGRSPASVRQKYRKGRDGVTGAEQLAAALKRYPELDDSTVLTCIECPVHIIADYHCPAHVRYTDARNEGKFGVTVFGRPTTLHKLLDSGIIVRHHSDWDCHRYADALDGASVREIRRMTRGSYRRWFEDVARDVRPSIDCAAPGDALGEEFMEQSAPLAEKELRKAAYRLAAALNRIFGKQ